MLRGCAGRSRTSASVLLAAMGCALVLVLLAATPAAVARIRVPSGVKLQRYASGIPQPSNLAFDGRGRLWATSAGVQAAAADGVWLVPRRGARPRQVVSGLFSALGLTWYRRELYVSHIVPHATFAPRHTGRVVAYSGFDGRRFTRSRVVVDGLPVERHRVDSIVAGPAGRLYLGIGSESDHEPSSAELAGTVVSFRPGGGGLRVEARGLRNPYGLAFAPGGRLLVSEHGRDDLGLHDPPDELDLVEPRGRARWYGFPDVLGPGRRAMPRRRRSVCAAGAALRARGRRGGPTLRALGAERVRHALRLDLP